MKKVSCCSVSSSKYISSQRSDVRTVAYPQDFQASIVLNLSSLPFGQSEHHHWKQEYCFVYSEKLQGMMFCLRLNYWMQELDLVHTLSVADLSHCGNCVLKASVTIMKELKNMLTRSLKVTCLWSLQLSSMCWTQPRYWMWKLGFSADVHSAEQYHRGSLWEHERLLKTRALRWTKNLLSGWREAPRRILGWENRRLHRLRSPKGQSADNMMT